MNNLNRKTYINSLVNLTARFYVYFNVVKLISNKYNDVVI